MRCASTPCAPRRHRAAPRATAIARSSRAAAAAAAATDRRSSRAGTQASAALLGLADVAAELARLVHAALADHVADERVAVLVAERAEPREIGLRLVVAGLDQIAAQREQRWRRGRILGWGVASGRSPGGRRRQQENGENGVCAGHDQLRLVCTKDGRPRRALTSLQVFCSAAGAPPRAFSTWGFVSAPSRMQRVWTSYSARHAAQLIGLPESAIRSRIRDGLVGTPGTVPAQLTFRDLSALRTVKALVDAGMPLPRVRRELARIQLALPDGASLAELTIEARGGEVHVRGRAGAAQVGQLALP